MLRMWDKYFGVQCLVDPACILGTREHLQLQQIRWSLIEN